MSSVDNSSAQAASFDSDYGIISKIVSMTVDKGGVEASAKRLAVNLALEGEGEAAQKIEDLRVEIEQIAADALHRVEAAIGYAEAAARFEEGYDA